MRSSRLHHLCKGPCAIADHMATRGQMALGPAGHVCVGEIHHRCQAHAQRMPVIAGLYGSNKGCFVGRLAPAVDVPLAFAAQVSVVDFHTALQRARFFAQQHGLHQLVLEQPGSSVGHADLAAQRQGTEGVFVLRQQVHGLEPLGQWHFGVLHDGARNAGALVAADKAFPQQAPMAVACMEKPFAAAVRAAPAPRPACCHHSSFALGLTAVAVMKLRPRQTMLELDDVLGHHTPPAASESSKTLLLV